MQGHVEADWPLQEFFVAFLATVGICTLSNGTGRNNLPSVL